MQWKHSSSEALCKAWLLQWEFTEKRGVARRVYRLRCRSRRPEKQQYSSFSSVINVVFKAGCWLCGPCISGRSFGVAAVALGTYNLIGKSHLVQLVERCSIDVYRGPNNLNMYRDVRRRSAAGAIPKRGVCGVSLGEASANLRRLTSSRGGSE